MQIEVKTDYMKKRLAATNRADCGTTAERFLARLDAIVQIAEKCGSSVTLNEGDALMFDIYCDDIKPARKQPQRKVVHA